MPGFRHAGGVLAEIGEGSLPSELLKFITICVSPVQKLTITYMGNDPCPISATTGVTHARFLPRAVGWRKSGQGHSPTFY